jgi:3-deoxy-D-manno-octulosonic-acid transferase
MAPSPDKSSKLGKFAGRSLARYMRFVQRSSSVIFDPPDMHVTAKANHPFIFAMWHGQFVMMPTLDQGEFPVSAIVARHQDAEIIGEMLQEFNMRIVRGAGAGNRKRDRGGVYALRTALKVLREGSTFAMTADVPPGPARRAGEGIVTLARLSGRPIVPFAVATSKFIAFPTWSRMTLNLPFSKMAYVLGDPVWVPAELTPEEVEGYRAQVEAGLNRVTNRAYALVGGNIKRVTPPNVHDGSIPPVGFALKAYRGITSLFGAVAPLFLSVRVRQGKEDSSRMRERYGEASVARPEGPLVWFHAASVGETNAILPLIERLTSMRPDLRVLLTTGTVTSAALASRRLGDRAIHQFVPLDVPSYVKPFFDHWKPDLVVFTESEIWPNLIIEAEQRKVPVALVNARMSGRSLTRWRRARSLSRPLFARFDIVLAQNEKLGRAFSELGAREVLSPGNLKIDSPPPPVDAIELERLRQALAGRRVLVAASTHEGEDEIVAEAHRQLARTVTGVCTIIAPRHPERGAAIAELLKSRGFSVAKRSTGALPDQSTDIYIADTIGELGTLFALAPVVFMGGSLVEHGGQNPIEPIGHGAAVLTGPHWENFRDFYRVLMRLGGARQIATADELATTVASLMADDAELAKMRAGAKTSMQQLAGALDRTAEVLLSRLPPAGPGVRRAS